MTPHGNLSHDPVHPANPVHPVNRRLPTIVARSGQSLARCYQCQRCTAGCPVAPEMDLPPHEVVLRALLGEDEAVLRSSAIWLCVGCETCGERCPNGISLGQAIPVFRQLALEAGVAPRERRVAAFHAASSASVRERGRLHEATLLLDYARRAFLGREGLVAVRDLLAPRRARGGIRDDVRVGLQLLLRRKLPLRAEGRGPVVEVRTLFERCARREDQADSKG